MVVYPKGQKSTLIKQFWFEIYPDSAPSDWFEKLQNWHIQGYVSPLHNKDLKPDGTAKKPHYHVIIIFDGGKSSDQCQAIADDVGAANGYIEVIVDRKAAVRYLSHCDFPKKHQYSPYDIICLSGTSISKYYEETDEEHDGVLVDIIHYINKTGCTLYCDLFDYALENEPLWIRSLRKGLTPIVKEYILSYSFKLGLQERWKR